MYDVWEKENSTTNTHTHNIVIALNLSTNTQWNCTPHRNNQKRKKIVIIIFFLDFFCFSSSTAALPYIILALCNILSSLSNAMHNIYAFRQRKSRRRSTRLYLVGMSIFAYVSESAMCVMYIVVLLTFLIE